MGTPELRTCYNKWRYQRPLKHIYGDQFILRLSGIGKKSEREVVLHDDDHQHVFASNSQIQEVEDADPPPTGAVVLHCDDNLHVEEDVDELLTLTAAVIYLTTIGFGDVSFKSNVGKILAISWLLISAHTIPELFRYISQKNYLICEEDFIVRLLESLDEERAKARANAGMANV